MKVLVTGAAGFVGSRIVELLDPTKYEIVALDCLLDGNYPSSIKFQRWKNLQQKLKHVRFIELDLSSISSFESIPKVDAVIHQAALAGLSYSWTHFEEYIRHNILATKNLCLYAIQNQVSRLIFASTSSVYGPQIDGDETSLINPISPYGITKFAAEQTARSYLEPNKLSKFVILRYFSIYGPGQRPDMAYSKFIDAIYHNKKLEITGNLDATRTNTYVDDAAYCTIRFLEASDNHFSGAYNVSGTEVIALRDAIALIGEKIGKAPIIEIVDARPGDQLHTRGDISKLMKTGLVNEMTPFETGITRQVNSYLSQIMH